MCGRGVAALEPQAAAEACGLPQDTPVVRGDRIRRNRNLHPGQYAPIVRRRTAQSSTSNTKRQHTAEVTPMRWGLVPAWTKATEHQHDYFKMFNARIETVLTSKAFGRLCKEQRCICAYNGFYEWKLDSNNQKQPYFVHFSDNRPMLMAALYDTLADGEAAVADSESSDDADATRLYTYTILTTDSSPRLKWLHNRMPVIVTQEQADQWLDVSIDAHTLLPQFTPYNSDDLVWHPVSKKMSTIKYHGDDCTEPIELQGTTPVKPITDFFKRSPTKAAATKADVKASTDKSTKRASADIGGSFIQKADVARGVEHRAHQPNLDADLKEAIWRSMQQDEQAPRKRSEDWELQQALMASLESGDAASHKRQLPQDADEGLSTSVKKGKTDEAPCNNAQ